MPRRRSGGRGLIVPEVGVEFARSMSHGSHRDREMRTQRPALESLEDRAVPATFGVPWNDPSHLTLSFAPDGTAIAGHTSSLFQTLERPGADRRLAAGDPPGLPDLGRAGEHQHRPGHRRRPALRRRGPIAARPAVRRHPRRRPADVARRALDLGAQRPDALEHLDGRRPDQLERALRQQRPRPLLGPAARGGARLRHRRQHRPELADVLDQYTDNQQLTSHDIATLQALYGTRSLDPHEGSSGNDTIGTATQIQPPGSYTGATPLVVYGDIGSNKDVDFYAAQAPEQLQRAR